MRPIGFSTGALAHGDFRRALCFLRGKTATAVELSALRENELAPLVAALDSIDLSRFAYVSVHAPSKYEQAHEREIIRLLKSVAERGWPIILHPDTVYDFSAWSSFGNLLLIENMDKRNLTARTSQELSTIFAKLPKAGLCFDAGHCRQVDPTMNESYSILKDYGALLRQLHVSEVNSRSTHDPLSVASIGAFQKIAGLVPENVPLILESTVQPDEIESEILHARLALPIASSNGSRARHERRNQHVLA